MALDRRRFLQFATAGAVTVGAGPWFIKELAAQETIKVVGIHDASGGLDIYGRPMIDCLNYAVEQINAGGGLLGKKVQLVNYDPQSNIQLYTQFATEAATKDKPAVVHGGITSASREAIRPVFKRFNTCTSTTRSMRVASAFNTLYFYNTLYEGGVCDRNIFCTARRRPRPSRSWCPT